MDFRSRETSFSYTNSSVSFRLIGVWPLNRLSCGLGGVVTNPGFSAGREISSRDTFRTHVQNGRQKSRMNTGHLAKCIPGHSPRTRRFDVTEFKSFLCSRRVGDMCREYTRRPSIVTLSLDVVQKSIRND